MPQEKNIIVIIPARGGSKGIPEKNAMDFCGKPLVAWSIEQAQNTSLISGVFVSSDDLEILAIAEKYGASGIQRPDKYATDQSGLEEVFEHAVTEIEMKEGKKVDVMICLQPTSPLRRADDIDDAVKYFIAQEADSLFSASKLDDACIWAKEAGVLKSVTYDYLNRGHRQDREPLYLENGSIYVFRPDIVKEYENRLGGKMAIYEMPSWTSVEIDQYDDISLCEFYMRKNILT